MWKLPVPPTETCSEDITAALTYANGDPVFTITEEERRSILLLYEKYDQLKGQPAAELVGEEMSNELRQVLHDAYGEVQEKRRLSDLRSRIKLAAYSCPYCGFGEVKDIDHHLPRSKFKPLAIYAKNLVPACHPCNNKKRAVAGDGPESQFFHTYLGTIPEEEFFAAVASVSEAGLLVNFSVKRSPNMTADDYERLAFQFQRLDLNNRYQAEVSTFITSQRTAIEMAWKGGADVLRAFLELSCEHSKDSFGLNDWRTALWRALSQCSDFYNGGFKYTFGVKNPGA